MMSPFAAYALVIVGGALAALALRRLAIAYL